MDRKFNNYLDGYNSFIKFYKTQHCVKCKKTYKFYMRYPNCLHPYCEKCAKKETKKFQCVKCPINIDPNLFYKDLITEKIKRFYHLPQIRKEIEKIKIKKSLDLFKNEEKRNIHGENKINEITSNIDEYPESYSLINVTNEITKGINPNSYDSSGWTPMHKVIEMDRPDILELLLKAGGETESFLKFNGQTTCLHQSLDILNDKRTLNLIKIISTLMKYGANINAKDKFGTRAWERFEKYKITFNGPVEQIVSKRPQCINKSPLFYSTNTSPKRIMIIQRFRKIFGIKMTKIYSNSVTHVIVFKKDVEPNKEVLLGIGNSCTFVTMRWVVNSIKKRFIQPLDLYTPTGTTKFPNSECFKNSMKDYLEMRPKLFEGGYFSFTSDVNVSKKSFYTQLITNAGGKVTSKRIEEYENLTVFYHGRESFSKCSIIHLYDESPPLYINTDRVKTLPITWVKDSLQNYKLEL